MRIGKLRVGSGRMLGFCEEGDIASKVRQRASAIRACYEQRLQKNHALSWKMVVRWTIALDGSVKQAQVAGSTLADHAVEDCVLRVIRRMHFVRPDGGVCIVQWPFVFSPGQ